MSDIVNNGKGLPNVPLNSEAFTMWAKLKQVIARLKVGVDLNKLKNQESTTSTSSDITITELSPLDTYFQLLEWAQEFAGKWISNLYEDWFYLWLCELFINGKMVIYIDENKMWRPAYYGDEKNEKYQLFPLDKFWEENKNNAIKSPKSFNGLKGKDGFVEIEKNKCYIFKSNPYGYSAWVMLWQELGNIVELQKQTWNSSIFLNKKISLHANSSDNLKKEAIYLADRNSPFVVVYDDEKSSNLPNKYTPLEMGEDSTPMIMLEFLKQMTIYIKERKGLRVNNNQKDRQNIAVEINESAHVFDAFENMWEFNLKQGFDYLNKLSEGNYFITNIGKINKQIKEELVISQTNKFNAEATKFKAEAEANLREEEKDESK